MKLPDRTEGIIGLLPSLILQKLTIENFRRLTWETQDGVIKLDLLNRNFNDTIEIKKNQEIAGLILLRKDNEQFATFFNIYNNVILNQKY